MSVKTTKDEKKCVAVHLPVGLARRVDQYKQTSGKSKNALLVECIETGLKALESGRS